MRRNGREALVYTHLDAIRAFTQSPECSRQQLYDISIHLAVLMGKITPKLSLEFSLPVSATSLTPDINDETVSRTPRTNFTHAAGWRQWKLRLRYQTKALSIKNGGLSSSKAAIRKERQMRVKAPKLTKDEAKILRLFGNMSIRTKDEEDPVDEKKDGAGGKMEVDSLTSTDP